MKRLGFVIGLAFGFLIAGARLNEYDVIHQMLLLQDLEPYFLMGSAVMVAAPLLWLLQRSQWVTPLGGALKVERETVQRKHVLGGIVFGAGWAVTGTCPGPAIAMVAGGGLLGVVVMAGLTTGVLLRDHLADTEAAQPTSTDIMPTRGPSTVPPVA